MCRGGNAATSRSSDEDAVAPRIRKAEVGEASLTDASESLNLGVTCLALPHSKSDYTQGRANGGVRITGSLRLKQDPNIPAQCIIGIQGTWYDTTKFAAHHPGGDILYEFHHLDATAQFLAYHDSQLLKKRIKLPKRGTYQFDAKAPGGSTLQAAWMDLNEKFEREGRYTTPISFLWSRVAILVIAFAGVFSFIHLYNATKSYGAFVVAATCMAALWQQSGFLMHDTMHNHIFHDSKKDHILGFLFGNVLLGASGQWWRDEHNEHHVFTNTVVAGVGPADPQMVEDVWIQDKLLIPFSIDAVRDFVLEYQQYYFVPMLVVVGLLPVRVDAIVHTGRYVTDICGLALHITWVGGLLWLLPTVMERVIFYALSNCIAGCLGIQLLVSHHAKKWAEKEDIKEVGAWAEHQIAAVIDITCPTWLDWFHGGLHIHSVHHLFPRMCRCHYREVYDDILSMCEKHGSPVDQSGWIETIARCVQKLSTIKDSAKGINGRKKTKVA
ncbi:fatty acid desaturase [Nitzschia inconspicua]|uniref:Fatty acid desaturase n=1 Tax=Nitzschia inconspicua TaxID=303405 RepID=A0A9K3PHM7_9STRA|nr:fatty acid desaturase [Nitzschia inconspicua]